MKENTLEEFIKKYVTPKNLCYKYARYPKEVQQMLKNIFNVCWRINLYLAQILYMLDEALKSFKLNENLLEELEVL